MLAKANANKCKKIKSTLILQDKQNQHFINFKMMICYVLYFEFREYIEAKRNEYYF